MNSEFSLPVCALTSAPLSLPLYIYICTLYMYVYMCIYKFIYVCVCVCVQQVCSERLWQRETSIWINKTPNKSSVNPKSTSNHSSKPCTVLQYPSRKAYTHTRLLVREHTIENYLALSPHYSTHLEKHIHTHVCWFVSTPLTTT